MAEDFFIKRKDTSIKKDEFGKYDHNNINDAEACGLENPGSSTLIKRNGRFFDKIKELHKKNHGNPVSELSELIEKFFTSREISFLLSKQMLTDMMKEDKKETNKKE